MAPVIEARKLVVSTVDITQTVLRHIGEEHVGAKIARRAKNIWYSRGAVLWANVALHEPPNYRASETNPDCNRSPRLQVGICDMEYLSTKFQAEAFLRGFPSRLFFVSGTDSLWDDLRTPPGKHITLVEQYSAPRNHFNEREWLQIKKDFEEELIRQWSEYAPNINRENVIGMDVGTPYDIEMRHINMRYGDPSVGNAVISQMGRFRPFPELAGYKTPVENVYVCGAGTHVAMGIARPNSYNCFKVITGDFGLNRIWEEKGRPY